jgi:hypothetical protein
VNSDGLLNMVEQYLGENVSRGRLAVHCKRLSAKNLLQAVSRRTTN